MTAMPVDVAVAKPRKRPRGQHLSHYFLLLPAILLSVSVVLLPGIFTLFSSFTNWNGVSWDFDFVGIGNYLSIFEDRTFRTAVKNNVIWTALFLTIPVALGLGAAMLLLRRPRTRNVYQVIFLLPYVMAAIVNAIVWLNMIYSPISGLFGWLNKYGVPISSPLSSTTWAIYGVAAVDIWHYWSFLLIIYLAALRQTPIEQVEAAQLDGASSWQIFRNVYLPNIRPTLQLTFIMIIIFSFLTFDYVFLMTQGGPANSTEIMATYAYSLAFATFQFGKAAAVGIVMGIFGLIASVIYTRIARRGIEE